MGIKQVLWLINLMRAWRECVADKTPSFLLSHIRISCNLMSTDNIQLYIVYTRIWPAVTQFVHPPRVQFIWRWNWNRNSYKANLIAWKSLTNDAARHKDCSGCRAPLPNPPLMGAGKCWNCCLQPRQSANTAYTADRQWHRLQKPVTASPKSSSPPTHTLYIHTHTSG